MSSSHGPTMYIVLNSTVIGCPATQQCVVAVTLIQPYNECKIIFSYGSVLEKIVRQEPNGIIVKHCHCVSGRFGTTTEHVFPQISSLFPCEV